MRFRLAVVLLLMPLLFLPRTMAAATAADITEDSRISVPSKAWAAQRLTDRDYGTYWKGTDTRLSVEIEAPEPCHGLYLCFTEPPGAWRVETLRGGAWETVLTLPPSELLHQYVPLEGLTRLRIAPERQRSTAFGIAELTLLGRGDPPAWVQRWQKPEAGADLLLLFAHPDDEVLYFGGTLPLYAGERGMKVVAALLSKPAPVRRNELLNSLWTCGVRSYPVAGPFEDRYSLRLDQAYDQHGKSRVDAWVTELIRRYRPRVMVTHDINGEYGHGMHRLCGDAALRCVPLAAREDWQKKSAEALGAWQVQKLYLHLYPENPVEMDWDRPLPSFGGLSGFEVARLAYAQHVSQQRLPQYAVEPRDSAYSSYRFGLAWSAVGPDEAGDDFFEHLLP